MPLNIPRAELHQHCETPQDLRALDCAIGCVPILVDPVRSPHAPDLFERRNLEVALQHQPRCPMTRQPLTRAQIVPAPETRPLIKMLRRLGGSEAAASSPQDPPLAHRHTLRQAFQAWRGVRGANRPAPAAPANHTPAFLSSLLDLLLQATVPGVSMRDPGSFFLPPRIPIREAGPHYRRRIGLAIREAGPYDRGRVGRDSGSPAGDPGPRLAPE